MDACISASLITVYRAPWRAFYVFGGIGAATALLVMGGVLLTRAS